ncbi:MAG: response regulator [Flavobacteriales bacterium]|nr:response regulator [Flavobacteriales bacterium]MCB9193808.1 response regulator [Flavobacteriales bacterium]
MEGRKKNVLVVEDEAIIRKDIIQGLQRLGYVVSGSARSGSEAVEAARSQRPDLVLMDIHLSDGPTGIDAAHHIQRELRVPIIFLTANSDEATVRSARIAEPYGFLVKPFNEASLQAAVEIAMYKHGKDVDLLEEHRHLFQLALERNKDDALFVKYKGLLVRCPIRSIVHLAALRDYVSIHLVDRRFVVHATLQKMEALLPASQFLRTHRSYIVRIDRIMAIEEGMLLLEPGDERIPIGGSYYSAVMRRLRTI